MRFITMNDKYNEVLSIEYPHNYSDQFCLKHRLLAQSHTKLLTPNQSLNT